MFEFEVKDGARTLQFNGKLLGDSTSFKRGSTRWIEFKLYITESGSYVLSRTGVSLVYHGAACQLVRNYNLHELPFDKLSVGSIPCDRCYPTENLDLIFPEKHRHWAQVSDNPAAILEALYKYDDHGSKYLTGVAQRLLESSGKQDPGIQSIYNYEIIP